MDSHSQTQSQGPVSERDYASGSESDPDFRNQLQSQRPLKRARHSPPPNPPLDPHPSSSSRPTPPQRTFSTEKVNGNGNGRASNPSASMSPGLGLPPLSLSFVGVEPLDEFILHVADWVHQMIRSKPPDMNGAVEVEAKIGMLREKASGRRLILPVQVETIVVSDQLDYRFESDMSPKQHMHFNGLLNKLKTDSSRPDYPSTPLSYAHRHLTDSFYPSDAPGDRDKIRVTRDQKTGQVLECMKKVRLGNLDVYSPKRAADWRISVNVEIPVSHPIGSATHTRKKDRMSYSHEEFSIDLTQVASSAGPNSPPELLHELELEFAHPDVLLSAAACRGDESLPEHDRSAFDELIRAFVNNARILVRNAEIYSS